MELVLHLLADHPDPISRRNFRPGHLTGSALILSRNAGKVCLVHHEELGRWLQPGGHVENLDSTILETALREAREETDLDLNPTERSVLVTVDVHEIPPHGPEPAHLHHDLMFLVIPLGEGEDLTRTHESSEIRWFPLREVEDLALDGGLLRGLRRAMRLLETSDRT